MANILLLSAQKPDNTGSGVFLKELAGAFRRAGHAVQLVAGIAAEDTFTLPDGAGFHPVRFETGELPFPVVGMSDEMPYRATRYRDLDAGMLRAFYAAFDSALDQVLAGFTPDVVFSNHLYLLTAHVVKRHPGVPIVGICHGSEIRQIRKNPLEREAIKCGIRGLSGIMALHEAQKADIVDEYGVPQSLVHVTGTGYNRDIFRLEDEPDAGIESGAGMAVAAATRQDGPHAGAPGDAGAALPEASRLVEPGADIGNSRPLETLRGERGRTLVFAGKVTAAKGVRSLLRALGQLDDAKGIRLAMAGGYATREEYDSIREQARAGSSQVEFPGRLPQEALAAAYRASDVFVLPSFYEGLPLVVVEALACGCKVVVTDLPGIRPWLESNAPGAPVWYVAPPAMRNVDEPEPAALPAFEQSLALALERALCSPWTPCDVSGLSWDALAQRALAVARMPGGQEGDLRPGLLPAVPSPAVGP